MKKRGIFIVTISLVLSLISLTHAASYGGGSGAAEDPYQIWTAAQLNTIGLNPGDWASHFKLMDNIDMIAYTGTSYNIIGNSTTPFSGVFDGNRHAISYLTYNVEDIVDYIGLFGCTDSAAVIKNLSVDASLGTGGHHVGTLVGYNAGALIACCANGSSIHGSEYVGGLVGENTGTVTSCWAWGQIWASSFVGGLIGENAGAVTSCYAHGYVGNDGYPGGLVGKNSGMVTFCYAAVNIESAGSPGGLVGDNSFGMINACFWDIDSGGSYPGVGVGDESGVAGLTWYEMHTLWLFTVVGWDFTNETANGTNNTWRMCNDYIVDYPKLSWQALTGDLACPDGIHMEDLAELAARWQSANCTQENNDCGRADMDLSGAVNTTDLLIFAAGWLAL